jgi:hypothetical protein
MREFTRPSQLFHGSYDGSFEPGTVLKARPHIYEEAWQGTDFYAILERHRPEGLLPHKGSVFMVGDEDDVDLSGGPIDVIYLVEPLGKLQRHDLNWSSEISCLMSELGPNGADSEEVNKAAKAYWNGDPHHDENVWEYLAPAMKIIDKVYDETSDLAPKSLG